MIGLLGGLLWALGRHATLYSGGMRHGPEMALKRTVGALHANRCHGERGKQLHGILAGEDEGWAADG